MKKTFLLILSFVFFGCFSVNASGARIQGLELEPWMVLTDDSQSVLYPAVISKYGGAISLNVMKKTGYLDYGVSGFMFNISVEDYTNEAIRPVQPSFNSYYFQSSRVYIVPQKKYSFSCGFPEIGGILTAVKIGLAPASDSSRSAGINSGDNLYYEGDRLTRDINLGAGISINELFDLGITIGLPEVEVENKTSLDNGILTPIIYEKTGGDYGFYAKINSRVVLSWLIIAFNYELVSSRITDIRQNDGNSNGIFTDLSDLNMKYSDTYNEYDLGGGVAANLKVNESAGLILGANVNYMFTENYIKDKDQNNIPYGSVTDEFAEQWKATIHAAFEHEINGQFTWRSGLRQEIISLSYGKKYDLNYYPAREYSTSKPTEIKTYISAGLTATFGNLSLDGVVSYSGDFLSQLAAQFKF